MVPLLDLQDSPKLFVNLWVVLKIKQYCNSFVIYFIFITIDSSTKIFQT